MCSLYILTQMELTAGNPIDPAAHEAMPPGVRPIRVVVMTAQGDAVDVTGATSHLLRWARAASEMQRASTASDGRTRRPVGTRACRPEWAALCRHAGQCGPDCTIDDAEPDALLTPGPDTTPTACRGLTQREAEIVTHLRRGLTNKEIAHRLGIKEDTVKKHLQAAYSKLGVHRRALVAIGSTL